MGLFFPHRIARLSYVARSIALGAVITVFIDNVENTKPPAGVGFALLLGLGLLIYWFLFVVAPRCRDLAMSGWFALLVLVPGVDLFFCGYLAWGRTKLRPEGEAGGEREPLPLEREEEKSDALRRLEALRDEGVLTEQDFQRRKARLRRTGSE